MTAGVFQDLAWARRGVQALLADGFSPSGLTLLARESEEAAQLIAEMLGRAAERLNLTVLGPVLACGPLLADLQGTDHGLSASGLAATMRRAGFQPHDGRIFEMLVDRGGVFASVHHDERAAEVLAKLHAYGGGNAAIGAWAV